MIFPALESLLMLAQRSGWRHYGYREYTGIYFESNEREAWIVLGLTALLLVALVVWHFLSSRASGRLPSNSPGRLFRELCRAHRLGASGRRLLKRLALARGLSSPVNLFVEPRYFDSADLPDEVCQYAEQILRLRKQLFGAIGS
jgi:hypothetical protein